MDDEDVDDLDDDDSLNVSSVGSCVDQLDDDNEVNEHHDISDSHNIPGILEEQFALADDRFEYHVDDSDPDFILFNDFDGSHDITQENIIEDHGFFTTNSGNTVRGVIHHDRMGTGVWTCVTKPSCCLYEKIWKGAYLWHTSTKAFYSTSCIFYNR
jgi:hypothetical protein